MSDFADWLDGLGLAQYRERLAGEDIDLGIAAELNDTDLERLGLSLGHRRRFIAAAARLAQRSVLPTESKSTPVAEVERRQVTVVFADIVDATVLASVVDPEDMQRLLLQYRGACAEVVDRFGGHIAQYLGDGILAYFGFPRALEDAAERAVRAALEIARAAGAIARPDGLALQARLGIASGAVVSAPAGPGSDGTVVGDTPNLAARLQASAPPGTVLVSDSTRRLVGANFEFAPAQELTLKGFAATQRAWRVLREAAAQSRFAAAGTHAMTELIGRERELAFLRDSLQRASAGSGHLVLLVGDAGMGKSRLAEAIAQEAAAVAMVQLRCQCSPYHRNSALHPFAQMLRHAAGVRAEQSDAEKLACIAALLVPLGRDEKSSRVLVADLLELQTDESLSAMEMTAAQRKAATLEILADFIVSRAQTVGVLLLVEDAHWIDPTSVALLDMLTVAADRRAMLLVITHRPEWTSSWGQYPNASTVACKPLNAAHCARLVRTIAAGAALDAAQVEQIVQRSDGVPLFAQELTRAFVELRGGGDERVPATLRDSLMARLDRLGDAKGVAQIASVFGREFEFAALASLTSMAPVQLDDALERLLQMQLVRKPTGDGERFYSFAHALLQEEAYESLAKTRRVELHRGVASLMQESASRGGDVLPELMAHHLARAGESLAACDAWLRAAEHARTRCAFAEALAHLRNAENEAPRMADHGAAAAQQLRIQLQIGATVLLQHGPQSEQVEQSMAKSRELASALDAGAGLFQATWGLYLHAAAQLKLDSARRYGIELISISERLDDDDLRMEALHHRWGIAYFFGDVAGIVEHTNTAFARYERQRHHRFAHVFGGHDLGACAHCVHAVAAVLTGHPEAMREQSELGIALAESLEHPVSLAFALASICATHWIAGDLDGSALYAQRLLRVAKRYALTLQCEFAEFMLSLFESSRGDARSGAAAVEKLFPTTRRQGFFSVFPTVAFVDVLARADRHDAALELIEHTLKALPSRQTGLFVSELWRQRGELRVCSDGTLDAAAERDLRIAIDIAQAQGAALFRLRGELSLARLLTRNRRAAEARTVLAAADASRMASEVPEVAELRAATAALFAG